VLHRLLGRQALLVIVPQELVEEVNALVRDVTLILRGDEARPGLLGVAGEGRGRLVRGWEARKSGRRVDEPAENVVELLW